MAGLWHCFTHSTCSLYFCPRIEHGLEALALGCPWPGGLKMMSYAGPDILDQFMRV